MFINLTFHYQMAIIILIEKNKSKLQKLQKLNPSLISTKIKTEQQFKKLVKLMRYIPFPLR